MKQKVLHLCLASFFVDNYSYQENLITKYHQALGYEVEVIASREIFDNSGQFVLYQGPEEYKNEYDIRVVRLNYRNPIRIWRVLRRYVGLAGRLEDAAPDIIFIHGCQFMDIDVVVRYLKKHKGVRVYVDNHADFNNSARNFLSKNILHKIIWKRCAHRIEPYTNKFYGVQPARVDFLKDVYKLPDEKCELLIMGADDDKAEEALKPEVRKARREEYGVSDGDFVIVTGGKIDHNKPQVLTLMKAVNEMNNDCVKLIVFGNVSPQLKEEFDRLLGKNVKFVGWRKADDIYTDFSAADLVAFPGLHSVLWEEAVGMGKPCLFRRIEGFEHIDLGGNCLFFKEDTAQAYASTVREAIDRIDAMQKAARKGKEMFSYRMIAKKSLEG